MCTAREVNIICEKRSGREPERCQNYEAKEKQYVRFDFDGDGVSRQHIIRASKPLRRRQRQRQLQHSEMKKERTKSWEKVETSTEPKTKDRTSNFKHDIFSINLLLKWCLPGKLFRSFSIFNVFFFFFWFV